MTALPPLPATFGSTRDSLRRVAVHIVARSVIQAGGRIDLRVSPGGFATPEFGDGVRVRLTGAELVREVADAAYESSFVAARVDGSSLADLAAVARVDLAADLYVGHDTPPLGDVDEVLAVDPAAAVVLADWYRVNAVALDRVAVELGTDATPTAIRLWPEHFDVALDLEAAPGERVNLGGSAGDGFHDGPYSYVGPWTDGRPGGADVWNAPFGAVLGYEDLVGDDDPVGTIADFMLDRVARFGS